MSSDLISIARSGANAARLGLDVTAQNIANAGTSGYVRRTVSLSEVAGGAMLYSGNDVSLHGVRLSGIVRNVDGFRMAELRRSGSDLARADAEIAALTDIQSALEQSGISQAIAGFTAALEGLKADPTNTALRGVVMESAQALADALNIAASGLDAARSGLHAAATDGVGELNRLSGDLAKINNRLVRAADGSSDQAALLDQRDAILHSMSGIAGVSVSIGAHQTAEVSLGGQSLVGPSGVSALGVGTLPDGSLGFDVGGAPVSIVAGSLAGAAQGLTQLNDARAQLDGIAAGVIAAVNGAQASGVALDGSAGQPLFAGTAAGDIALHTTDPSALATAPAGAPAGSRDAANLGALIGALGASGAAQGFDNLLTGVSAAVAGRTVTRDALATIAEGANAALLGQAGVSLDDEAANLLRFQQAFQASGRVMQVARDLFDTILSIR